MTTGTTLIYLATTLAAATFGGIFTLRRIGESGPSCVVIGFTGAATLTFGVLAILPSFPIQVGAMLPLLATTAALGVGWTTDTASVRLPHITANTALAAVSVASFVGWNQVVGGSAIPGGVVVAIAVAPAVMGAVLGPPTRRTVIFWHLGGITAVTVCSLLSLRYPESHFFGVAGLAGGLTAVLGVTLVVLTIGRVLVRAGKVGAGDPVWVTFCVMAAASHAVLSAGGPIPVWWASLAVAVTGASVFLVIGGVSALALTLITSFRGRRDSLRSRIARQPVLAGQWATLGLMGFAVVWKFTPFGLDVANRWTGWAVFS